MYNPSRGGVRGGADQFTWESVKSDKHRENYLGHSLMAPVGRWQKGKDLSWYAKERKANTAAPKPDRSELDSIKRAEEEAMLIALGHNIVRKTQPLSKEEIREALKRNTGEKDEYDIERVDGVGASSHRVALLSGVAKDSKQKTEGVVFEGRRENTDVTNRNEKSEDSLDDGRKRNKKKSKKHKKHKKYLKESCGSDSSETTSKRRIKHKKKQYDSDSKSSSKTKNHKKSKRKHKDYSSGESEHEHYSHQENKKRHKKQSKDSVKRHRHDSSESD